MSRLRFVWLLVGLSLAFALVTSACRKRSSDADHAAAPPLVTDASTDLLFTWIDEKGAGHVEQRPGDVPAEQRETVRVADPTHDPPADEIWIVDLRAVGPDGRYPVHTMKRDAWEALAAARRDGGALVARPPSSAPPAARPDVIIYGASWCGPCHQAAAYLTKRGVPFVEKDIEEDRLAAREMQQKLARAGKRGGSIPVIDVRGRILIGFDAHQIDQALGEPM